MKIWLCYAKAGGGHKAPAEALGSEIKKIYPQAEIKLIDLAEKAVFFIRMTIEGGYSLLIHNFTWLYILLYRASGIRSVMWLEYRLAELFMKTPIKSRMVVDSPDGIVCTHFLVSPIRAALKELKRQTPIFVIVTDPYSPPSIWFFYTDLTYIVYSEEVLDVALRAGVPRENVIVMPQILNHQVEIVNDAEKAKTIAENDLSPDKKLILILGGAYGLPKGEAVLEELIKQKCDENILVVCGHNERSKERMTAAAAGAKNVKICGFVDNIPKLIAISDLVIGKAGAGVVWETVLSGKPLLITHFVYGQEKGTKDFVAKNGLGWYETDPKAAAKLVCDFMLGKAKFKPVISVSSLRAGNQEIANFLVRSISSVRP